MDINERLALFRGMVLCCHNLYLWHYDSELTLLESNCPDAELIGRLMLTGDKRELLLRYAEGHRKPIVMSNDLRLMWVAVPEKDGAEVKAVHILGPFFADEIAQEELSYALRRLRLPGDVQKRASAFLRELPVISLSRILEYALMFFYCITGEQLAVSDLHYQEGEASRPQSVNEPEVHERHGTYELEQEMVRMVREGDLNYRRHMNRLAVTGRMGKLSNGEPTRQMKNAVLVCVILFSRAAIEGGVAPEISLTLTDRYFQGVEACRNFTELNQLALTMQDDFVQRVHRCRSSQTSRTILTCQDYIQLHLEEELTLRGMAEALKFSESHLGRRFREELGVGFKDYVRAQKLERAKVLLKDPTLGIREISEKLHFCTPSYFAETFKAVYGVSPTEWREKA